MSEKEVSMEEKGYVRIGFRRDTLNERESSLYIRESLIKSGKPIGSFGPADLFNEDLIEALEKGWVDMDGNLTEAWAVEEKNRKTMEEVTSRGHKREEPKVDRSTSGKKPKNPKKIDEDHSLWLESLDGHHAIIEILDRDIRILVENLLFASVVGEDELKSLLEQNLIILNSEKKYILTEKGKEAVHKIKALKDVERSLNIRRSKEMLKQENTSSLIEEALRANKIITYNVDRDGLTWYSVNFTLVTGEELSCRIKDGTSLTGIRNTLLGKLREHINDAKK